MQHISRILMCVVAFTLAACSSFDKRFAEASRADAKGDRFAGSYSGRWNSSRHPGGGGNLRCILTPVSSAGTAREYRADFHATWHGVFSSEHSVVLQTKPSRQGGGVRDLKGTSELRTVVGSGTYRCEGTMDGNRIRASYDATYDAGTFDVSRGAIKSAATAN